MSRTRRKMQYRVRTFQVVKPGQSKKTDHSIFFQSFFSLSADSSSVIDPKNCSFDLLPIFFQYFGPQFKRDRSQPIGRVALIAKPQVSVTFVKILLFYDPRFLLQIFRYLVTFLRYSSKMFSYNRRLTNSARYRTTWTRYRDSWTKRKNSSRTKTRNKPTIIKPSVGIVAFAIRFFSRILSIIE